VQENSHSTRRTLARLTFADHVDRLVAGDRAPNSPEGAKMQNLAGLSTNLRQIQGSTTTDAQYQRALAQFRRRPDPPGQVLNWVCRDNLSYLDLTQNRLEMDPD